MKSQIFNDRTRNEELKYCKVFEEALTQESFENEIIPVLSNLLRRSDKNIIILKEFLYQTEFNIDKLINERFLTLFLEILRKNDEVNIQNSQMVLRMFIRKGNKAEMIFEYIR